MTLIGNKSGRRKILWGPMLKVSLAMVPLSVGGTSLAYILFADTWNPLAAWLGLATGFSIVLIILIVNFFTPIYRLPFVR